MRHAFLPVLMTTVILSAPGVAHLGVTTLAGSRPGTGDPIPPLHLYDLKGHQVLLESFRGKPVLLHFWATWCQHCRTEMPLLEQTARAHAGKLVVLGVN
ncbi:MAG TPA: TlpA disulfide reductase family protein, partial [Patescibacteria group bacterium]|nr:TlpA disulfide reductase family protein [Patescibacteria group bacterium]